MPDLLKKAVHTKRETRSIEFKEAFDPNSSQDWCELIKDIVAIANSGGGIILFGLDSVGKVSGTSVQPIARLDPADVSNKISKYTGSAEVELEICEVKKRKRELVAFVIQSAPIPIVFRKPGTYDIGSGRQRTAFSVGTVYFRHGAKSEPGTSDDIRKAMERQIDIIRASWISGVRKVVEAPQGSQIVTVLTSAPSRHSSVSTATIRAVNDPTATPIHLTRDQKKASGVFVHEELSEGIFDEINNLIDANSLLAKGKREFFLGQAVYYRIYAERHHVKQGEATVALLLHSGTSKFYAPSLYWILQLPEKWTAEVFSDLYLRLKTPHIQSLIRVAILLGRDFATWLLEKWQQKWKQHPQPPSFYWTFKDMVSNLGEADPRIIAARAKSTIQIGQREDISVSVKELLDKPEQAATYLSETCVKIFEGSADLKGIARALDYFAYGLEIEKRSALLTKAIIKEIGEQQSGDLTEAMEEESRVD
jgi:hypothetical protein